jgi:hypothetical protein
VTTGQLDGLDVEALSRRAPCPARVDHAVGLGEDVCRPNLGSWTATMEWPRPVSSSASGSQHHAPSQAPCTSAKVVTDL